MFPWNMINIYKQWIFLYFFPKTKQSIDIPNWKTKTMTLSCLGLRCHSCYSNLSEWKSKNIFQATKQDVCLFLFIRQSGSEKNQKQPDVWMILCCPTWLTVKAIEHGHRNNWCTKLQHCDFPERTVSLPEGSSCEIHQLIFEMFGRIVLVYWPYQCIYHRK